MLFNVEVEGGSRDAPACFLARLGATNMGIATRFLLFEGIVWPLNTGSHADVRLSRITPFSPPILIGKR